MLLYWFENSKIIQNERILDLRMLRGTLTDMKMKLPIVFTGTYCEERARKDDVRALEYGNEAVFQDSG